MLARSTLLLALLAAAPASAADLTAVLAGEQLVARGAEWRYFRGRSEPSGGTLAWTLPEFGDSGWQLGTAGIGYGDADDATLLSDMSGSYSTVYARRAFEVRDGGGAGLLWLSIDYDDGFVAYLNGTEVARANAGAAGQAVSFDDLADDTHEAGTPEVFLIPAAGILRAGTNVLAILGLNRELINADFSLHPALRSDDVLAPGCPGEFFVAGADVLLSGTAPLPATHGVRVNGADAAFDPPTGGWSHPAPLAAARTTFTVEALDASGGVLASLALSAIRASPLGAGTLGADLTIEARGSPHVVLGPVVVPAGRRLMVEAGCEVLLSPGAGFTVGGEMHGAGTVDAPVRFSRLPCQANWGHILLEPDSGPHRFRFCEWSYATGEPGCLTLSDSDLEIEDSVIRDIDGEGVHATGSRTRIRRCLTERTNEALSLDRGDTVVEFCTVRDAVGKSDLIDSNGSTDPPARIAFNHIHGTTDDGIDGDLSSMDIEGNIIHDCGDQAISLVGAGTSRVVRNVCYRNGNGLSVKDSAVCHAEFNTFALNTVTGARAIEKTAGRGGGVITLRNSIVWGNAVELLAESGGSIDASFCDVEGGAPPGPGNLSLDPLFAEAAAGDFRLLEGSPCIGAAADGSDLGALPRELAPRAPADLLAAASPPGMVTLSWRDNSSVEEGFEVERAVEGGAFEPFALLPADARSHLDGAVSMGGSYRYRVRAYNSHGSSLYSNVAAVTLELPPPELAGLEPAEGPSPGGTPVVIRGRNFREGAAAWLGTLPLAELSVWGPEELRAVTPGGGRGSADLRVVTPDGEALLPSAFRYFDAYDRGDSNGDGSRGLADARFLLEYLFLGGPPSPCMEAADASGDGRIDLRDPVLLLFFLFLGGAAPSPAEARCYE